MTKIRINKCKFCNTKMEFDEAPTSGWVCKQCGYRIDINCKEYNKPKKI